MEGWINVPVIEWVGGSGWTAPKYKRIMCDDIRVYEDYELRTDEERSLTVHPVTKMHVRQPVLHSRIRGTNEQTPDCRTIYLALPPERLDEILGVYKF
jgi:hypothetical protein